MNVINDYFDKVFIITSFDTKQRIQPLDTVLKNEGIECEYVIAPKKKYFCIDKQYDSETNNACLSLISANESIFLKCKLLGLTSVCIIEDDIWFDVDYKKHFTNFISSIPTDWDILNLGYHVNSKTVDSELEYYKYNTQHDVVGTHIVAYKCNDSFEKLISMIEYNILPMDWFLSRKVYSTVNTFIPLRKMFYGSSYRENESDKTAFYKKYKSGIQPVNLT